MEGLVCGRYRIIKRLGSGGMAEVWLGQHDTLAHQQAAIKLLQPHMSTNKMIVKRFLKEAEAASAIKHLGIVKIFDVGFVTYHNDEHAYIIMEFLEGETLSERLKREGQLPLDSAIRLIRQLAGAMEAAHDKRIYHRDLKPDNLFIIQDPEVEGGERIKVLDFGLAKHAETLSAGSMTRKGAVFGTPAYMAPEQCLDSGKIDGRADLYSIGCILFKCLCGVGPFVADDPIRLLDAHLTSTPPSPRSIRSDIPPDIDALILKLLAKDPAHRIPDCATLLAALGGSSANITIVSLEQPVRSEAPAPTLVDVGRASNEAPEPSQSGPEQTRNLRGEVLHNLPPMTLPDGDSDMSGNEQDKSGSDEAISPPPHYRTRLIIISTITAIAGAIIGAFVLTQHMGNESATDSVRQQSELSANPTLPLDGGTYDSATTGHQQPTAFDASIESSPDASTSDARQRPKKPRLSADEVQMRIDSAKVAFGKNDYETMYELCFEVLSSHGNSRHLEASRLCAMAACKLADKKRASRHFKHLKEETKPLIRQLCSQEGIELAPATP